MGAADNTAPLPSPQDFGIASTSSTSVSPGASNVHDPPPNRSQSAHRNPSFSSGSIRPFRSSGEIRRKVFLAEFDLDSMTPAPTAIAYLKLKPEQCTVTDVAQISKEYLNVEEDLIMLDTNGFEILDNPGTRGKLPARYRHLHRRTYQNAPRLIIIIIHKLKALLLNKFLLHLARRYLSFVRYLGSECKCCFSLRYVGIVDWLFCWLAKTICLSL